MLNQIFSSDDLDQLRRDLMPATTTATFYGVNPTDGEVEIKRVERGWHIGRKLRQPNRDVSGAVTLYLAADVDLDIEDIREQAIVKIDLERNGPTRTYKIVEVTSTQQIGGGWVLHCEPVDQTV